jgi:hypothetical protein
MIAAGTTMNLSAFPAPVFTKRIITIVGGYGSGKSEVAVNLARRLGTTHSGEVVIADLDVINPYFRSREAAAELQSIGVRSLVPPGAQAYADLPIILPEIRAAIERNVGWLILDVGGDDLGARVLSSLRDAFAPDSYELAMVLNARRPFTADAAGSIKTIREIELASRMNMTGLISNTHLMADTTPDIVREGLSVARQVGDCTSLPIFFLSAVGDMLAQLTPEEIGVPVLPLERSLLKPWERMTDSRMERLRRR